MWVTWLMAHAARIANKEVKRNNVVLREDDECHQLLFVVFSQILKKKKKILIYLNQNVLNLCKVLFP